MNSWNSRLLAKLGSVSGLLLTLVPCGAEPKVVVILVHEGLTTEELGGAVHHQRAWMLWHSTDVPTRALTLSTGRFLSATAKEVLLVGGETPYEHGLARSAFLRRTGIAPPVGATVALGAGALARRGALTQTFASRMRRLSRKGAYFRIPESPAPTPYALLAVDEQGYLTPRTYPDAELLRVALLQMPIDWAVVEVDRWNYTDWELLIGEGIETWVLCTRPPPDSPSPRLTAVVRYSAREPNGLLTSPTTRWAGLIREVDLVPSLEYAVLRRWQLSNSDGAPAFDGARSDWHRFWNGLLPRSLFREVRERIGFEGQSDTLARILGYAWVQEEIAPVILSFVGDFWAFWWAVGVILWRVRWLSGRIRSLMGAGLAVLVLAPAVFLSLAYCPIPIWTGDPASDSAVIVGWLVGVWFVLAVLTGIIARWRQLASINVAGIVVLSAISGDMIFAGGYGLNRSLVACGLRGAEPLYGVDAFWLGVLLAMGTLIPTAYLENRHRGRLGNRGLPLLGLLYGCLLLIAGLPLLGANYSSWIVLGVGLGLVSLYQGRVLPDTLTWRTAIPAIIALVAFGLGVAWLMLSIDRLQVWQKQALGMPFLEWYPANFSLGIAVLLLFGGVVWLFRNQATHFWEHITALRWGVLGCRCGGMMALFVTPNGWVVCAVACASILVWSFALILHTKAWHYLGETNGKTH